MSTSTILTVVITLAFGHLCWFYQCAKDGRSSEFFAAYNPLITSRDGFIGLTLMLYGATGTMIALTIHLITQTK